MKIRKADLNYDKDSPMGEWSVTCDTCPLKPHSDALGLKPRPCAAGIETNCQGAVLLSECEFYQKESVKSIGKRKVTIECNKAEG